MKNQIPQETHLSHFETLKKKTVIENALKCLEISEISPEELVDLKSFIGYLQSTIPAPKSEIADMLINFYDCLIMIDKDKPKESMFSVYLDMLKDLTVAEISMVRRNILSNNKFFPTISEILKVKEGANEYAKEITHKIQKIIWSVLKIDTTESKYFEIALKNAQNENKAYK